MTASTPKQLLSLQTKHHLSAIKLPDKTSGVQRMKWTRCLLWMVASVLLCSHYIVCGLYCCYVFTKALLTDSASSCILQLTADAY